MFKTIRKAKNSNMSENEMCIMNFKAAPPVSSTTQSTTQSTVSPLAFFPSVHNKRRNDNSSGGGGGGVGGGRRGVK